MNVTFYRSRGVRLAVVLAVVALTSAACGDDSPTTTGDTATTVAGGGSGGGLTIVAKGVSWDLDRLEIAAGQPATITIENQDDNIPHNLHIKVPGGDGFKTEIVNGPATQQLDVTIDEPGEYTYLCDVHPNMEGKLVVS